MVSVDVMHHEGRKFFLSCFMLSDRREGKLVRGWMRWWRRGVTEEGEGGGRRRWRRAVGTEGLNSVAVPNDVALCRWAVSRVVWTSNPQSI